MEGYISLAVVLLLGLLNVWLLFRKAPHESRSLNGSASEAYAKAAKITAEETRVLREELEELREKTSHPVTYHLDITFTIGDEPSVGEIAITQLIPERRGVPVSFLAQAVTQ